jgi:hypothetical protein
MRFKTDMKIGLITSSVVLLLTTSPASAEKPLPPGHVIPRETSVLLLPPLDATPDSAHMLTPRSSVIRHREEYEFITRQFRMLGETMAANAAHDVPQIKLIDLSARTAANMDLLAKRTGADWVVSIVVQEVKGDSSAGQSPFKVRTRVLLQVWDARRHGWLADAPYTAEDSGGGSPIFVFKNSLDVAAKGSLGNLLDAYAPVVSVDGEGSMKDYLAGQKQPFVGDPKTPFSGLKNTP